MAWSVGQGHGWYTDIIPLKELKNQPVGKNGGFCYFFEFSLRNIGEMIQVRIFLFNWVESTNYLELLNEHDLNGWN